MAGNVMEFSSSNWDAEVIKSTIPVVVDFWAVWCGPCRMIAPAIDQLANEYSGKIKVGKVNVDDNNDLAAEFGIASIPQVYIFKNGQVVQKLSGAQGKGVYQAAIDRVLG
jgi:thioredoxin 1